MDLKSKFLSHPLVSKILKMIALIKGENVPNKQIIKSMFNPITFKAEISLINIGHLKAANMLLVNDILLNTKGLTPEVRIY